MRLIVATAALAASLLTPTLAEARPVAPVAAPSAAPAAAPVAAGAAVETWPAVVADRVVSTNQCSGTDFCSRPPAAVLLITAPRRLAALAAVVTATGSAVPDPGQPVSEPARPAPNPGQLRPDPARPASAPTAVDVRGQRADGTWGEWTPAGEPFAEPAVTVQARLTAPTTGAAGPGARIGTVSLTAHPATARTVAAEPLTARSFTVFATREGLVGRTTANGHVIVERDHFVALPSRRGLSIRGTGDYSVRVCAANGRCAWAPVWDVGPWNTRDDHWNPPGVRQMWGDLPHGMPQAQAAFLYGYNGGLDQYGRRVRNPAGIDLADGTFWDALRLTDNAWVTVTYLWTGRTGSVGTVATWGVPLNVRVTPDTRNPPVGLAGNHAQVHIECQVTGQTATGTQGTTNVWLRISPGRFVSKAHVAAAPAPPCG